MSRVIKYLVLGLGALLALSAAFFFAVGGGQMLSALRGPTLPRASSLGGLEGDLQFFRAVVLANERGARREQYERFESMLEAADPPQSADEMTLIASRALAVFENAHTTVMAPSLRRLPLRLHWTADALVIVKARPEHEGLLGKRVVSLGGKTPDELLASMPDFVGGGTAGWVRYRSEYFLTSPLALASLGANVDRVSVELRTRDVDGAESILTLDADAAPLPADPFWDFLHSFPGDSHFQTEGWATLLQSNSALPLYLQETDRLFLVRDLPEHDAVYVRMNGSIDDDQETVAQFTSRALGIVKGSAPQNIIVDFRFNRGGDYTSVLPLVRDLSRATPGSGRLYLITGPNTFSAGILAGSQFERYLPDRLTIVGEEVGDQLRFFRGEGVIVTMPHTGMELYLGRGWDDVAEDCGWFADCWPPNKFLLRGVGSMAPDLAVANTWEAYRTGRDLVTEAIFADIATRSRAGR